MRTELQLNFTGQCYLARPGPVDRVLANLQAG